MNKILNWVTSKGAFDIALVKSAGLFALRLSGLMIAFGHGLGKLTSFGERAESFSDPLGVSAPVSLGLTVFAEFFCGLALAAGFLSRAVVIPMIITMLVAALVIHADDPFGRKELALLYILPFVAVLLSGPGRFSVDYLLFGKK